VNLNDKAQESPDVELAGDLIESVWELKESELTPADEITPEGEFPKYGDFAKATEYSPYGDGQKRREGVWIEIPQSLAQWLVENGGTDVKWQAKQAMKVDGAWDFDVVIVE
jgi:hypothetical protein